MVNGVNINRTYIQQLVYNGLTYTSGSVISLYDDFRIVAEDFPFKKNPKAKELPVRDWAGGDGVDIYVPAVIPMKEYEIEVLFLYVRNISDNGGNVEGETPEQTRNRLMRTDINDFIDFICGRKKGKSSDSVQGGRLAVYDEYVGMGRKDVIVSEIDNELYFISDADSDVVAQFKVKFKVNDPTTEVTPYIASGQSVVSNLNFSGHEEG